MQAENTNGHDGLFLRDRAIPTISRPQPRRLGSLGLLVSRSILQYVFGVVLSCAPEKNSPYCPPSADLSTLHLSSSNFSFPSSIVLPHLKTLSLLDEDRTLLTRLLSPTVLPSLRALGLLYGSREEAAWISEPAFAPLFAQLEVFHTHYDRWCFVDLDMRRSLAARTLVGCSYTQIQWMLEDCVTNLMVYDLDDVLSTDDPQDSPELMQLALEAIARKLEIQNPLQLRLLYFEECVRVDPSVPQKFRDAIEKVLKVCEDRKLEVIWTIMPAEINSDSFINQDFWDRQKKIKGVSGAGGAGGLEPTE